jgi:hypothetical protein
MLFKNVASQKVHVYAYDSTTGAAKTGDAANITAYVSLDGTANAVDDTNPAEVDATNMPGIYCFDLAQAETNCNSWALYAKSSTSNIRIEPIIGFTTGAAVTQTGDSYAIVNHADYGNAKLVRSTTPENTLSVDASHLVAVPDTQKVDVETVKTKAITCADAITVLASVGTAATSTAQTGDSYAIVNGDHGLVSIKDDIDAILADVGDASGSTLGSLYAILGNAEASLTSRTPAALTANGNMKASLMEILATALTETSGYLAAGFKKFFNVGSPTGTVNSLPDAVPGQTGGLPTTNGTKLNQTVDADMKKINGHTLGGDGSGTPFGPVD